MLGFPRTLEYAFPYLNKYFVSPLGADVFYYGYSDDEHNLSEQRIADIVKPIKCVVREFTNAVKEEIWDAFGTRMVHNAPASPEPINVLSQYYNMMKCFDLIRGEAPYDLVIRVRPDYFMCRELQKVELNLEPNSVYIPSIWDFGGVSSGYAHGNFYAMEKYCQFFTRIRQYNEEGFPFHCETMKAHHIKRVGLNRMTIETPYWWEIQDFDLNGYSSEGATNPSRRHYL